jgi:hypothetical protein
MDFLAVLLIISILLEVLFSVGYTIVALTLFLLAHFASDGHCMVNESCGAGATCVLCTSIMISSILNTSRAHRQIGYENLAYI